MGRKKGIPRKTTTLDTDHQSSESEVEEVRQIQETPASQLGETPLDLTVRTDQTQSLRNVPDVSKESKSRQNGRSARDTSSIFGDTQPSKRPRIDEVQEDTILDPSTSTAPLPGPWSGSNQSLIEGLVQLTQNLIPIRAGSMMIQHGPRYPPAQLPSTSSFQAIQNVAGNAAIMEGESNRSEKKHQCPYCPYRRYKNIQGWRVHFKKEHSQLKFCNVYSCGREYDTDQQLRSHKREDHTREEIDDLTTPNGMTFCPFCKELWNDGGICIMHIRNCYFRPKGQDALICELHPKNMYLGSAEEKRQHDDKVHKHHHSCI